MDKINTYKRELSLITLAATMGGFLFGFDTAVVSGTIELVKYQFQLNAMLEGWFVSSALLGCMIGVLAASRWVETWGRKGSMLIAALLFGISALGCGWAPNVSLLVVFRLLGGVGIGLSSVVCPLYITEMAPANLRGRLVTYYQLAITLGILGAYLSNTLFGWHGGILEDVKQENFDAQVWRGMFIAGAFPALIFALLLLLIPESPRWLLLKGRESQARQVLQELMEEKEVASSITEVKASLSANKIRLASLFKGNLKLPMLLAIAMAILSQFSGINAIIYYGPSILDKAGFAWGQALGGQVAIGLVNTLFTFVAIGWIDKGGRRPLLLWGIAGCIAALLGVGICFALQWGSSLLILGFLLVFIACFSFSFGSVVWVLLSEFFPTAIRGTAVSLATLFIWLANWLVGQFFPILNQWPAVPFLVFGMCCCIAFLLILKWIPETKGKTLEEIERSWR